MKKYLFCLIGFVVVLLVFVLVVPRGYRNSLDVSLSVPGTSVSLAYLVNGVYDRGVRMIGGGAVDGTEGDFLGSLSLTNILPSGEDGSLVYTLVSKKQSTQALARDITDGKFNNRQLTPDESSGVLKEVKGKDYYIFPSTDTMGYPTWVAMTYGKNEAIIVQLIFSGYSDDTEVFKDSKTDNSLVKVLSHITFD